MNTQYSEYIDTLRILINYFDSLPIKDISKYKIVKRSNSKYVLTKPTRRHVK